ncbi:MAG: hypothetical protein CUN56_14380, partial [Phototrophicales bacterium]
MNYVSLLLVSFGVVLSPLYFWDSGLPQLSHICAALGVLCFMLVHPGELVRRRWLMGWLFVLYTVIVNMAVFVAYKDRFTAFASVYYAFNMSLCVVIYGQSVRCYSRTGRYLLVAHCIAMCVVVAMVVGGASRSLGGVRIMGYFNDPNQLANWVLCSIVVISVLDRRLVRSQILGDLSVFLGAIAIFASMSRSGVVGLLLIASVRLVEMVCDVALQRRMDVFLRCFVFFVAMVGVVVVSGARIVEEIVEKKEMIAARFNEQDDDDSLSGRGYDRLWLYPQYLILGAGEGAWGRFSESVSGLEIHSSWAGVLFSYGVFGSVLLGFFVFRNLKRVDPWNVALLLGPVVYG